METRLSCTAAKDLGLRARRGHDLRRTMISLARIDGARKDILELCTHNPRKKGSPIDVYTEFPWASLCAEVAKLKVDRRVPAQIIELPRAAAGGDGGGSNGPPKRSTISQKLTTPVYYPL